MCLLSLLFGESRKTKKDDRDWIQEEEICMYEEEEDED